MLTELQISRLRFHLGYGDYKGTEWLEFKEEITLKFLTPNVVLQLVGRPPDDPGTGSRRTFFGQDLCEVRSLLDKTEAAWDLIDSTTIENSQKVVQAGSVTLRQGELGARQRLYQALCRQLALVSGVSYQGSPGSVGY